MISSSIGETQEDLGTTTNLHLHCKKVNLLAVVIVLILLTNNRCMESSDYRVYTSSTERYS